MTDIVERLLAIANMDLRTGPFLAHTFDTAEQAAGDIKYLRDTISIKEKEIAAKDAELERLRNVLAVAGVRLTPIYQPPPEPLQYRFVGTLPVPTKGCGCICPPMAEQTCLNPLCPRGGKVKDQEP